MPFRTAYRRVEPCVVAIAQKYHLENQDIPNILGTGWFVSEHGVIATCQHVVDAALLLPRVEGGGYPFQVFLWQEINVQGAQMQNRHRSLANWLPLIIASMPSQTLRAE